MARQALALVLLVLAQSPPAFAIEGFKKVGSLIFPRTSHAAAPLPDGAIVIVSDIWAERYEPATESFALLGLMTTNRGSGLTATVLQDGRVLIAGGQFGDNSLASAELYDPAAGTLTATGSMTTSRSFHTATLLVDGRVLVTGGHRFNHPVSAVASAEIYDPSAGTFSATGDMSVSRQDHTATLLADGRVLVVGGYTNDLAGLASAELYDLVGGTFAMAASLSAGRGNHTATLLASGNVLVAGGHAAHPGDSLTSAEVYDVASGSFAPTGALATPRGAHSAVRLLDERVLLAGGFTAFPFLGATLASAEIYDETTASFVATGGMHDARGRHAAALLPPGDVLVAGGFNASAELFSTSFVDTTAPVLSVPGDMTVFASEPAGAVVFYNASASDDIDPSPQLDCQPASGSTFPLGTTTVVCTATDASGNSASASFEVTVIEPLSLTLSIAPFGSVVNQTGIATVAGSVSCNRPTQVFVSGDLMQTIANRAVLRGFIFAPLDCVPPSSPWSANVSADAGRFKAGQANVNAFVSGCDSLGSCDFEPATKTIRLRGR